MLTGHPGSGQGPPIPQPHPHPTASATAEAGAIGAVGAALGGAPAATAAPGDMPAAKRPKTAAAGGAAGPAKPRKESDDVGVTVDNLIDYDQETNQLMEGERALPAGRRAHTAVGAARCCAPRSGMRAGVALRPRRSGALPCWA